MADQLPPIIQAAERFRAALLMQERQAAARMVRAYAVAYRRLQANINALVQVLAQMPDPTWAQVERLSLYRALRAQIESEIGRYAVIAGNEIRDGATASVVAGLRDSERLVQLALPRLQPAQLRALWVAPTNLQVETLVGFLADDSPLFANLNALGEAVGIEVADKLRTGIILGFNPRKVAREITNATGQGLTWSLNTSRTAYLWAYREASRANYLANSHIVQAWTWFAQIGDPRTCMSCIANHGSEHPLEDPLNDHHSGRCAMLPKTLTYRELGFDIDAEPQRIQSGETWFRTLSAAEQRARMGESMYKAWRAGEFNFRALSQPYQDDVYGEMLREASLRGLIGDRAKRYYAR